MTLMQLREAGEMLMNSPPILAQARWNSWPLSGAIIKTWMPRRRIRVDINCMVKLLPAPLVPKMAIFAFL